MKLVHWARLWSPTVPLDSVTQAWETLELPGLWEQQQSAFISTFQQGAPTPTVSLLLHHFLNIPGDRAREDWMRAISWLKLEWTEARLPPDHLAIGCEVLAVADQQGETVLVEELKNRYLLPWCDQAITLLSAKQNTFKQIPLRFKEDLQTVNG